MNRLYVERKTETGAAALDGLPTRSEKRRALAHLAVSDEITAESRQIGHAALAGIGELLERSRERGPMRTVPLAFVVALFSAQAEATGAFTIGDPVNAEKHCVTGFDAFWRMIA